MKSHHLTHHFEFIKFIVAGGIAAVANFISRIILSHSFNYALSIVFAYIIGMVTAYMLCRLFVFTSHKNTTFQQINYFILVNVLAILQTIVVSFFMKDYVFLWMKDMMLREASAHFIGICIPIFTSYFGHKHMTFK